MSRHPWTSLAFQRVSQSIGKRLITQSPGFRALHDEEALRVTRERIEKLKVEASILAWRREAPAAEPLSRKTSSSLPKIISRRGSYGW